MLICNRFLTAVSRLYVCDSTLNFEGLCRVSIVDVTTFLIIILINGLSIIYDTCVHDILSHLVLIYREAQSVNYWKPLKTVLVSYA